MTYILGENIELGKKKHKYSNNISKIILINLGRANEKKKFKISTFYVLFVMYRTFFFLHRKMTRGALTHTQAPFIDYVHWGK